MHKEIINPKWGGKFNLIGVSLGLTILLVLIVGLSNLLHNRYGVAYSGYIAFLLYVGVGILVYRGFLLKYSYSLIKDDLVFESLVGNRNRSLVIVPTNKILYLCPLNHEKKDTKTKYKTYRATPNKYSNHIYVLAFDKGDRIHRVIFEPSKELLGLLKNL